MKKVAVLGATGAVGREMIRILEERAFPLSELKLLASAGSVGKTIPFRGEEIPVEEAGPEAFAGCDIVLGAAQNPVAKRFAPDIVKAGAVFVDNSSAFRLDANVPLIVPEINPEDVKWHEGILSNPNCSTIITAVGVNAIHRLSPIKSMVVSTYQAASGAGQGGLIELEEQMKALAENKPFAPHAFRYQLACNLIPEIGSPAFEDYTTEEMKMQNEGRKILHAPELTVTCTCVRVPVMRSHSISATIRLERPVTVEEARAAVASAPGCRLVDDLAQHQYPMPLDTSDQDLVFVGRIRKDLTCENGLTLFICGDQIRKGAATNTVQIAELL
ncbi:MAG: aspartate-semialdehyde dehydrogenase [Lachnospiraceae bacterium]|nr:aspartate-semialdehyde dehydrogenase [Lachnospiraceae bacterium]